MDTETKMFFEGLEGRLNGRFDRIEQRLDRVEKRLDDHDHRFDRLERNQHDLQEQMVFLITSLEARVALV